MQSFTDLPPPPGVLGALSLGLVLCVAAPGDRARLLRGTPPEESCDGSWGESGARGASCCIGAPIAEGDCEVGAVVGELVPVVDGLIVADPGEVVVGLRVTDDGAVVGAAPLELREPPVVCACATGSATMRLAAASSAHRNVRGGNRGGQADDG